MSKYKRRLAIANTRIKYLGNNPAGFAILYDTRIPYYQLAVNCVFWKLNIDYLAKDKNGYVIRLGPNSFSVPPVGYRTGYLDQRNGEHIFHDVNEDLIFSEELLLELIRLQSQNSI